MELEFKSIMNLPILCIHLNYSLSSFTSNIIIVSHLVTHNYGDRYELSTLLEKICIKHNLGFINPVRELTKNGYDIHQLVENEKKIYHYSNEGHTVIKTIYEE
jgi:hypothetical protein